MIYRICRKEMETSHWSPPSLGSQPIPEHDGMDFSLLSPRNTTLFRSYRNLTSINNGYDSRISLHSNLPAVQHSRSQYFPNDPPPFWFQRSSSARNLRPNNRIGTTAHLQSTSNLFGSNPRIPTNTLMADYFESSAIQSAAASRLRGHPNRYSMDVDLLRHGGSDMNLSNTRSGVLATEPHSGRINGSAGMPTDCSNQAESSSHNDPFADVTDMISDSSEWSPLPSTSTNTAIQTFGLDGVRDNLTHHQTPIRTPFRNNNPTCVRTASAVQTRLPYTPSARRTLGENQVANQGASFVRNSNARINLSGDTPRSHIFRRSRAAQLQAIGNETLQPPTQRPTLPFPASTEMSLPDTDRPIHVVRHPTVTVQREPGLSSDVQSSTNISGASSIEDLPPVSLVTPNTRRVQIESEVIPMSPTPEPEQKNETDDVSLVEVDVRSTTGEDWRSNCSGSRELWRRLLLSERFADVWFVVGGSDVADGSNSSRQASPDPGAPGGPSCRKPTFKIPIQKGLERVMSISSDHQASVDKLANTCEHTSSEDGISHDSDANTSTKPKFDTNREEDKRVSTDPINIEGNMTESSNSTNPRLSMSFPSNTNRLQTVAEDPLGNESNNSLSDLRIRGTENQTITTPPADLPSTRSSGPLARSSIDNAAQSDLGNHSERDRFGRPVTGEPRRMRFGAHRLVLSTASPVFEAMFYGPVATMSAHNASGNLEYQIPDISPRAFRSMLLYIYTDEIQLDDDLDTVFYVLYASKKYMLPQLGRLCVEHLKDLITASNVCAVLDRSLFFDEADLTRRCWHVIDVLASHVLSSPGLLQMEASNFKALLKRDTLNCNESEVFAAVRRWAGAECVRLGLRDVISNRAQVAADYLRLVRFPTMTLNDFAENVAYSGFLSLEVVRDLFVHITTNKFTQASKSHTKAARVPPKFKPGNVIDEAQTPRDTGVVAENRYPTESAMNLFSFTPRKGPKLWRCTRFSRTGKHTITSNPSNNHTHSVSFQISNQIFLSGVGVYGSTHVGDRLTVRVELKLCHPKPTVHLGVTSVGTQFHGNIESPTERRYAVFPRSSSLMEFTRYDWTGRTQPSRRTNGAELDAANISPPRENGNRIATSTSHLEHSDDQQQRSSRSIATAKAQIVSDGTSRIFDVHFACPVKLLSGRRYLITLNTVHKDHSSSVSSSATAINSSTFFIGFFGRPEVRVVCPASDVHEQTSLKPADARSITHPKSRYPQTQSSGSTGITQSPADVVFRFWENAECVEPGEIDRGFLPELLFYTCF